MKANIPPFVADLMPFLTLSADRVLEAIATSIYGPHKHKLCFQTSYLVGALLSTLGIECRLAAGSAFWKMLSLEEIGGLLLEDVPRNEIVEDFGYQFDEDMNQSEMSSWLSRGELPEIHVWLEVRHPKHNAVVVFDPTLGLQAKQLEDLLSLKHRGSPLPKYLLGLYESLGPSNPHTYTKSEKATNFIHAMTGTYAFNKSINDIITTSKI